MSTIDALIVIGYIIAMMVIGYIVGKKNETQEDYFLAGRSMHWIPVALSVAATTISANSFIGKPGQAYTEGFLPYMQSITIPLACFIAMVVTVPLFYYLRVSSIYEYMEMRFGGFTRNLTVIQFFINTLIQTSSTVYIPALIIQQITGWEINTIVPIIVVLSIIYTLMGGIKAVIWTDATQMVILWGGAIAVLVAAVSSTGMGFGETIAIAADAGKYEAFNFSMDPTITNTLLASCFGIFQWTRYFCFDQAQMQRVLTSKSMHGIKRSFMTSAIVTNITSFALLFAGTILFVFYQGKEFSSSNDVAISFILQELPVGILGLVVAAVFAAAMSSVDSLLNSMTTVFTKDIYEKYFAKEKNVDSSLKQTMIISTVLGAVVIAVVIFGFNGTIQSVLDVVGTYISYFSGPALGAFLLALFTTKANDKGTAAGFLIGFVVGFYIATTYNISWLINPAIGCTITVVLGYLLSGVFKSEKSKETVTELTASGLRAKMIKDKVDKELMPFTVEKYSIGVLAFFVLQYVVFAMMS